MKIKEYFKRGIKYVVNGIPVINCTAAIYTLAPNQRLAGKKIVVTGGGRGLGKTMAKKFISEGANVLIAGRNEAVLREASLEVGCHYLVYDVRDAAQAEGFIKKADEILCGMNVLVNNAGISLHEWAIENVSIDQFDTQFKTNLRGGYFLTQQFLRLCERAGKRKGNILFTSSERGTQTDDIPYGLSKAAINSFVKGIAPRIIKDGIRINAVAPGITTSEMTGFREDGNLHLSCNPGGRVYLPAEVAEVACFLVSDASGCVSGQIIECNEGKTGNSRYIYQ